VTSRDLYICGCVTQWTFGWIQLLAANK